MFQLSALTPFKRVLLVISDAVLLLFAIFCALSLREFQVASWLLFFNHVSAFLPVVFFALISFFISNLYEDDLFIVRQKVLYRITMSYVFVALAAVTFFYTYPYQAVTPKSILLLFLGFAFLGTVGLRYAVSRFFGKTQMREGIVIATGPESQDVYVHVNKHAHIPLTFRELVPLETAALFLNNKHEHIGCIVVNTKRSLGEELQRLLFERVKRGTLVLDETHVYEMLFRKIELSDANYRAFFEPLSASKKVFGLWKRCVDIFVVLLIAVPSAVLVLCAAIAIRFEGKGTVFISQTRLGKFGRRITLWKLRTMTHSDSGKWLEESGNENKVTKVGYFLRKSRIDELPQLWSILKGDLSLIGPRPDLEGFVQRLSEAIPYYDLRYTVTPGLSGWAQINQEKPPQSVEETRDRLAYDLYYVKNRSIPLDMYIGFKTIKTLLSRTGM